MSFPGFQIGAAAPVPAVIKRKTGAYLAMPAGEAFLDARLRARVWAEALGDRNRFKKTQIFISKAVAEYAARIGVSSDTLAGTEVSGNGLDFSALNVARALGENAAALEPISAAYWLSVTYTAMLPDIVRSRLGVYYTPPALSARLLDMATGAGTNWKTCRVLDPACGGGAFLGSAALRMVRELAGKSPGHVLSEIEERLRGFEVDPFAARLSQIFLEIALAEQIAAAGRPLCALVRVCDALEQVPEGDAYDLVVGNPPYGRVGLSAVLRERYSRSLYGHANLYGVFTDLALRWTVPGGVIAYVTPTSFLAGEYFKALRYLLAREAPPVAIDFIDARKGVFEDVLQETMLATYRRNSASRTSAVHRVAVSSQCEVRISRVGCFRLSVDAPAMPWLMPRSAEQAGLIQSLTRMKSRLTDWGYKVSTGPLVWNRHKQQLRSRPGRDTVPLVWAESIVGAGRFVFRARKRNHAPFFKLEPGDDWLRIDRSCVLLQRTTAKEQARRLIAAALPQDLIDEYGAVVVENHLNMIRSCGGKPSVSPAAVAAVLNSEIADLAFRCISGSVAVSAFELEALPLPSIDEMKPIERLLAVGTEIQIIEKRLRAIYVDEGRA